MQKTSTIAFWPLDVYGLKAVHLEHAPTKVSWVCLLDPAVYHKSCLPVQLHTLLRSWNAEFLLLLDQPTNPSFLSKCLSVCHFFIPLCHNQVWSRVGNFTHHKLKSSISPYQIIDPLPTSASKQCQLLLHTKVNNKDYNSLPVLKECGQLGTWIKNKGTHTIQYNTIPIRTPKLTCGRAVEDSLCKRWTFLTL